MTKKENESIDRQLETLANNMLMTGWLGVSNITDEIYKRLLVKLKEKIDYQLSQNK